MSTDVPEPTPTATMAESMPEDYPPPGLHVPEGYPAPLDVAVPTLAPITEIAIGTPTPPATESDSAIITGVLLEAMGTVGRPMPEATLYLAEMLYDTEGRPSGLAALHEDTAPSATTDADGRFAFRGVPPGIYVLMVRGPVSSLPVVDKQTGMQVEFEVVAGEVLALGLLHMEPAW